MYLESVEENDLIQHVSLININNFPRLDKMSTIILKSVYNTVYILNFIFKKGVASFPFSLRNSKVSSHYLNQ